MVKILRGGGQGWWMGWVDNSEICLKWGGGVIKESLLKLLKREGGQRHNCS